MGTFEERGQWPPISYETLPWERDQDELAFLPKSARRRMTPTYDAALPLHISDKTIVLPSEVEQRISETSIAIVRFDMEQSQKGYDLPALLLRSESAASSKIEHLTSSVRNVALAEVSQDAPQNARLIAGNVAAMREALSLSDGLTVDAICSIHRVLMENAGESFGGELRDEQVWVGGSAYSPHGALFVPPASERVPEYLSDLVGFAMRDDVSPIAQAALLHAQFETIHPFIDGNGRTGRTLLHKVLRHAEIPGHVTLPVSAGLLHNIDSYMRSLAEFQQGNPVPIVEELVEALDLSLVVGKLVARDIDNVMLEWGNIIEERKGSSIYRLPKLLAEQPVVDVSYVARRLDITTRAASSLINRACEYGMLRAMGNRQRGEFYQADALIEVLEEASSLSGIRRMLSSVR